ncbi:MAG: hypothetical protein IH934_05025 [Nanoarchaeota archaeon]|nr:hypothetical protein [Nanoarchaeota archaeon]
MVTETTPNKLTRKLTPDICSKIDEMIKENPKSLSDIGGELKISGQTVLNYLNASFQNGEYKKRRIEFNQRKKLEKQYKSSSATEGQVRVVSALKVRLYELAQEEGFAYEKAIACSFSQQFKDYSLDSLIGLYRKYAEASESGMNLLWEELGRGLDIHPITVAKMLNEAGLDVRAEEESFALQKTFQYVQKKRFNKYPYDTLISLFEKYKEIKDRGDRKSLKELTEGSGLMFTVVGRILDYVSLEPFYPSKTIHKTPAEKMQAIQRGFNIDMSGSDIAYFIGLPRHVVSQNFLAIGNRTGIKRRMINNYINFGHEKKLTLRLQSQIYKAFDADFTRNEISQLLDTKLEFVNYAIMQRYVLEPKIIGDLRILFSDNSISRPYIGN